MAKSRISLGWTIYACLSTLCVADLAVANGSLFPARETLVITVAVDPVPQKAVEPAVQTTQGSLFLNSRKKGLFADYPPPTSSASSSLKARPSQLIRLRKLIEKAESRRDGYDAVQHGATIKPGKRATRMTLAEINKWIDDTPGQPHAIGRYQFIPPTLRRLTQRAGLPPGTVFSPKTQDRLADILLKEAGLNKLQAAKMTRTKFMHNLAKTWAGLPLPSGKSYYHGHAGNKASISWDLFEREMALIFPDPSPNLAQIASAK